VSGVLKTDLPQRAIDSIAKNRAMQRRALAAERIAAHLAAGRFTQARAEADFDSAPAQLMAMAMLACLHTYGIASAERAFRQFAAHV
jgi:hypothetical protein